MGGAATVLLGIASGLITGFLVFGATQVFDKVILPWYRNLVYDGLNVAGTWQVVISDPPLRRNITYVLKQRANIITGFSTHVLKDDNEDGDKIRTYELQGELRETCQRKTLSF